MKSPQEKMKERAKKFGEDNEVPPKVGVLIKVLDVLEIAGWFLTVTLTIYWVLVINFVESVKIALIIFLACSLYYIARYLILLIPILILFGISTVFKD